MSVITHEDLRVSDWTEFLSARQRTAIRNALKRAAIILVCGAIMLAAVTAIIGLKSLFILSRLPLVH